MNEQGVIELAHPTTGEPRYQAIARIKGQFVLLGFWPTYKQALKAYNKAVSPS
jgi:hypothetical protein